MILLSVANAIATFLFQSAASGIVGEAAYAAVSKLYEKHRRTSITTLYVRAFNRSLAGWYEYLERFVEPGSIIEADDEKLKAFFDTTQLELSSLYNLTEPELTRALAKGIAQHLIMPGHSLLDCELENLALRIVRQSAIYFLEEIAHDEGAFRMVALQDCRLAAYDRKLIIGRLEKLPTVIKAQFSHLKIRQESIEGKIDRVLDKVDYAINAIEQTNRLPFNTIEELRTLCKTATTQAVSTIPKYIESLYIPRENVEREIAQFLESDSPCVLVQGEAGIGKTNLLCNLARTLSFHVPTLFFRGNTNIAGRLGFARVLADELSALSRYHIEPTTIIHLLDRFLEEQQSIFVLFIDAINENRDIPSLKESLGYAAQDLIGTRIKLCISCRDIDWHLFEDEDRLSRHLYEPKRSMGRFNSAVVIGLFSETEFTEAWKKYSEHYRLKGTLGPTLESTCKHPLMLQFLCDAFQGKQIPLGIHRKEIFDQYWVKKIIKSGGRTLESAVYSIVDTLYRLRSVELKELEVIDLIGEEIYLKLLSEQVIIYTYHDPILDQNTVGFTYEAFLEYVLARSLRQKWDWPKAGEAAIYSNLKFLIDLAEEYRILQGVVQYLLLFSRESGVVRHILLELAERGDRWKIFFCDMQTKLEDFHPGSSMLSKLGELARDENPQVRWAVGYSLGTLLRLNGEEIKHHIDWLVSSADWRSREVAAFALGHSHKDIYGALGVLESLANDINWRVRRAVGYASNSLCMVQPDSVFPVLQHWAQSNHWRVRFTVVKSQKALFVNLSKTLKLLQHLSQDSYVDVRWLVVINLVSLVWHQEARTKSLKILTQMTKDQHYWVRKHIATWIPELYLYAGDDCLQIFGRLLDDTHYAVRWELARSLGRMRVPPSIRKMAERLMTDTNTDVRFAAVLSMRSMASAQDIEALMSQFDSGSSLKMRILREQVARSSHLLGTPKRGLDLLDTWRGDRYLAVMEAVNKETRLLSSPDKAYHFFSMLLADEDEGIRWAVASVMSLAGLLPIELKLNLLHRLINDSHYWVRREAITSLKRILSIENIGEINDSMRRIVEKCSDENAEVRFEALKCLDMLPAGPLLNDLINNMCLDKDPQVSELARRLRSATS